MSDDSNLNNHGKQDTNISESRRLKVVGGSDFEAEFDNSPTKVQNNYIKPPQTEEEVGTISREELDARLAANRSLLLLPLGLTWLYLVKTLMSNLHHLMQP